MNKNQDWMWPHTHFICMVPLPADNSNAAEYVATKKPNLYSR